MSISKEFVIEVATADDLDAIGDAHSRAFLAAYPEVIPSELFDPEIIAPAKMAAEYRRLLENLGPDDVLLKAVAEGRVIGGCACGVDTELGESETGYVQRIYVVPDWWGKGVGSALVRRALELLKEKGFRQAALQVLESNRKARSFYEKRGWKLARTVREKTIGRELRYTITLDEMTPQVSRVERHSR